MANCPICKSQALTPTKISDDLAGSGCAECGGVLLGLVNYRVWREGHDFSTSQDTANESGIDPEIVNTESACQCPKCRGVMSKYRFSVDADSQLDFCFHCEEIWFDQGEWALLEELALTAELTQIFTHPWQHALVQEKISQTRQKRWKQRFGDDYDRVTEICRWILDHPSKSQIMAYITNAIRGTD